MRRTVFPAAALLAALVTLGGCGGSSSSSSDLAGFAPPGSLVYMEGTLRPTGELKTDVDAIAKTVAGVDNLGALVIEELEESALDDGEPFDYATEVEPWVGERASLAFKDLEDGDPANFVLAVESTDTNATQEFIDTQTEASKDPYREVSYEGVDFRVGGDEDHAVGIVGDFLVLAEDEQAFKEAVDASDGESLGDEERFESAFEGASEGSLADLYVDVGGIIEQSGDTVDPQAREILANAGIDPSDATAVASATPGSDRIEVDLSSDLGGEEAPTGDASELLGSLPAESFAAVAVSSFGNQIEEALDALDKEGIDDTVPPNQLKKGLKQLGIDLDELAASLQDGGIFAVGSSESSLGGALVLSTEDESAVKTISSIGRLLRRVEIDGVTALRGKVDGFSIRSDDLGDKPLVVAAEEERLVIGYGLPATMTALAAGSGRTLSDSSAYKAAVAALGDTPISGFADGPAALRLADSMISPSDDGFEEAKPYLRSIEFLALGSASQDDELATAKLIIGLE
ncbi:MAG TPA: DUF3352 domain-containing protein [Solirubrobacterales bacterium]|nr:DUF3352 domain-containing protein [Solirubrobacterales bacterium]